MKFILDIRITGQKVFLSEHRGTLGLTKLQRRFNDISTSIINILGILRYTYNNTLQRRFYG